MLLPSLLAGDTLTNVSRICVPCCPSVSLFLMLHISFRRSILCCTGLALCLGFPSCICLSLRIIRYLCIFCLVSSPALCGVHSFLPSAVAKQAFFLFLYVYPLHFTSFCSSGFLLVICVFVCRCWPQLQRAIKRDSSGSGVSRFCLYVYPLRLFPTYSIFIVTIFTVLTLPYV